MEALGNIILFESDEEFTDFCLEPYGQTIKSEKEELVYTGVYSEKYKKCISEGIKFLIKDKDSIVPERNCVSKRVPIERAGIRTEHSYLVQMDVQNLTWHPHLINWMAKSNTNGHAAFMLSQCFYFGDDVINKNIKIAVQYLKKAIELGNDEAIQFQKEHKIKK